MTPELRALLKRRESAVKAAKAITSQAIAEDNRDLTDDESEQHAEHVAQIETLNSRIESQKTIDAASVVVPADEDQPVGQITGGHDRKRDDPTAGFKGFGDFATACVAAATRPGSNIDERLLINAALPGTYGNESVGSDGGFLVPAEYRTEIMQAVNSETSLFGMTDQIPISGNSLKMPIDETTDWQTSGGITTAWEDEVSLLSASKPQLKLAEWNARKITSLVAVSDDLLEDAPAMDAYLRRRAPSKVSFAVDRAIFAGDGVGRPLGILNAGALITVAKESGQAADTIVRENINKMYQRFPAANLSNAVWLANQDIMAQLEDLSFVGTDSPAPLFIPTGGLSSAPYDRLKGRPIVYHQACETLGDVGDLTLVDMSQYATVVKQGGVKVDTSMHLYFDANAMAFRFILRVGGHPWLAAPIQPRAGANTLSPFVTLAERA